MNIIDYIWLIVDHVDIWSYSSQQWLTFAKRHVYIVSERVGRFRFGAPRCRHQVAKSPRSSPGYSLQTWSDSAWLGIRQGFRHHRVNQQDPSGFIPFTWNPPLSSTTSHPILTAQTLDSSMLSCGLWMCLVERNMYQSTQGSPNPSGSLCTLLTSAIACAREICSPVKVSLKPAVELHLLQPLVPLCPEGTRVIWTIWSHWRVEQLSLCPIENFMVSSSSNITKICKNSQTRQCSGASLGFGFGEEEHRGTY